MIKEFIFVDDKRLKMYYEQFGPPEKYIKVPEVGGGVGLTGPKVAVTQKRYPRVPTRPEKIEALLTKLRKDKLLVRHREKAIQGQFVLETCTATRLIVPRAKITGTEKPDLALWVSKPESTEAKQDIKPGLLCLFEAYQGDDRDETPVDSEFSVFVSLVYALYQDGRNNLLLGNIGICDLDKMDFDNAWNISTKYIEAFHEHPEEILKSLGCNPALSRTIEVLYKVRESDIDWATYYKTSSVFGYPIYIVTA